MMAVSYTHLSVQVGFGEIREKLVNKPEKGHFDKAGVAVKRFVDEYIELAIPDDGLRTTYFFRYAGFHLEYLGSIPDLIDSSTPFIGKKLFAMEH